MGDLCLFLFFVCITLGPFSFAIILKTKRELVALLLFTYGCNVIVNLLLLFLALLWVGLQCVIVVFPDYTHFL